MSAARFPLPATGINLLRGITRLALGIARIKAPHDVDIYSPLQSRRPVRTRRLAWNIYLHRATPESQGRPSRCLPSRNFLTFLAQVV